MLCVVLCKSVACIRELLFWLCERTSGVHIRCVYIYMMCVCFNVFGVCVCFGIHVSMFCVSYLYKCLCMGVWCL